jgi:predicted NACHT family NTPase
MKIYWFKTPNPKRFQYQPRYFDQEKEESRKVVEGARLRAEGKNDLKIEKGWLKEYQRHTVGQSKNFSRIRIIVILTSALLVTIIALIAIYYFYYLVKYKQGNV